MIFIYNLISSGINTSNQIKETNNIQNEANYVLTVFREFHERGEPYQFYFEGTNLIIEEKDTRNYHTEFNTFLYNLIDANPTVVDETNPIIVEPKKATSKSVELKLTIQSKKFSDINTKIKTTLHRL